MLSLPAFADRHELRVEVLCGDQVLVATGEGNVALLQVQSGSLQQVAHIKMDAEVACLDISPSLEGTSEGAAMAAVGDWRQQLHLLSAPNLTPITQASCCLCNACCP